MNRFSIVLVTVLMAGLAGASVALAEDPPKPVDLDCLLEDLGMEGVGNDDHVVGEELC